MTEDTTMNQNNNIIEQTIKLVARTGLFFAKADGHYSEREHAFIDAFVAQLALEGSPDEARALVADVEHEAITLHQLVADTRALLGTLPPDQADTVLLMLYAFATDVVNADGTHSPAERQALTQWRQALARS